MTFSVVCAEAMASKEAALVLDCGDEAQQVQERKNEGAKNLPAGTAVIKAPSLIGWRSAGHFQGGVGRAIREDGVLLKFDFFKDKVWST